MYMQYSTEYDIVLAAVFVYCNLGFIQFGGDTC